MAEDKILTNDKGFTFTMTLNDWESAPDPICMCLVTDEQWDKVATQLQDLVNNFNEDDDKDDCEDLLWTEYEYAVLRLCRTFYYEDLTNEEYDALMHAPDAQTQCELAEKYYKQITQIN